jgi:hypothetical protein
LWELRNGDKAGKVSEIGTFIIELDEAVVLGIVSASQWF